MRHGGGVVGRAGRHQTPSLAQVNRDVRGATGTWIVTKPQGIEPYTSAVNADDVWPLRALAGRRSYAGPFGLDGDRRA